MNNLLDFSQGFRLPNISIRGRFVKMAETLDKIIGQHNYPEWVSFQLVETLLINAAIASAMKGDLKISLQVHSEGALKMIATDVVVAEDGTPELRGYAKFDEEAYNRGEPVFKGGYFGVIIDYGPDMSPYKGLSGLEDSIAKSAENYFAQSEQIPTRFLVHKLKDALGGHWFGGAIMVQGLADQGGKNQAKFDEEELQRVSLLLDTMGAEEMLNKDVSSEVLIYRLFHEDNPVAIDADPIRFGCPCSEERVRNSLSIYSQKDLENMTTEKGDITADCQFCGAHYVLDPKTVGIEASNI